MKISKKILASEVAGLKKILSVIAMFGAVMILCSGNVFAGQAPGKDIKQAQPEANIAQAPQIPMIKHAIDNDECDCSDDDTSCYDNGNFDMMAAAKALSDYANAATKK